MSFWTMPLPGLMRDQVVSVPIEYIGQASGSAPGNGGVTVAKPAGTGEGDLLLAFATRPGGSHYFPDPPGWLVSHSNQGLAPALLYRFAAAAEPADYTFSALGASRLSIIILCYRNAKRISIYGNYSESSSSSTSVASSIVLPKRGLLVAHFGIGNASSVVTPPSGLDQVAISLGANPSAAIYHDIDAPAGSTGDRSLTWGHSNQKWASLIGID